ncbi:MAG TPA: hypothetical protein PK280_09400 [Planctomycetota bacterium]|nr:hypothetical protein [Planctomycetota bacterium]
MPVRIAIWGALLLAAAVAAGGCKSTYAKGTPFYTGPVNTRGERANVWPLAYYQEPNLSVMWPSFEKTPDHLALRPLWSVYGLDEQKHEYNVLWPWAQFDYRYDEHRILPFLWGGQPGDRYFVAFPEVWWFRDNKAVLPFFWGGRGDDAYFVAFPWFWSLSGGHRGAALPFFWGGRAGARHFVAFPEVWWYPEHKAVLPFFWGGKGDDRYFVAFPWFWSLPDHSGYAPPFFWGGGAGRRYFGTFPAVWWYPEHKAILPFFWGGQGEDRYFVAFPGFWQVGRHRCVPPVYWNRSGDSAAVVPLFWYERDQYCHLLPLWMRFSEPGGSDTYALGPIVNFKETDAVSGWRVWPLVGDYRGKKGDSRYSFALWPLGHYRRDGDERMRLFLPLYYDFAGRDSGRRALVPLYWGQWDRERAFHLTPLFSAGRGPAGSWSLLLPVYYHGADASGRSSRTITPLFARASDGDSSWAVIPPALSWITRRGSDRDLWALGPLFHSRWGGAVHQSHAMPFYYYDREGELLFTPLYAQGGGKTPWSVLVPFYYRRSDPAAGTSLLVTPLFGRSAEGDRAQWLALPGLCSFTSQGADRDLWTLGPLAHFRWGGASVRNHVLPLYYYDRESRTFLSPLYSQGGDPARRWSFLLPAYWHQSEPGRQADSLVTPLFGRFSQADRSRWLIWPALSSVRSDGPDREVWGLGPLSHFRWGGGRHQSHVLPLYFHDREAQTFVSLPFSRVGGAQGFWNALGLGAHHWWYAPDRHRTLVPPALSFYRRDGADRDLWTLGPLARVRWGGEHHQSHVLPLYFHDREARTFLSLPFSRRGGEDGFWNVLGLGAHRWWEGAGRSGVLVPPALTFYERVGEDRDFWTLGPLVRARWGGAHHQSHALPFYYWDRERQLLLTLPFSRRSGANGFWNVLGIGAHFSKNGEQGRSLVVPPALTALAWDREERDVWTLGGLAHARWGGARRESHLLPLYVYDGESGTFLSLPFSRRAGADGFWNVLGLLAHSSDDAAGHRTVRVLPPFTAFAQSRDYSRASVYPLFSTHRSGDFRSTWVFPWAVTESGAGGTLSEFVPLWWYESGVDGTGYRRNFHVLGWLYDDHQEHIGAPAPKDGKSRPPAEHVRRRVLWKIWDYERVGQDVAVDAFPFISYDRRPDEELKRFSFAWRLFRWERSAGGGRKLDVLFIPFMRRAGQAAKAPVPASVPAATPAEPPAPGAVPAPAPETVPAEGGAGA